MGLFDRPSAPKVPAPPPRAELQLDALRNKAALGSSLRDQILERRTFESLRGRTSLVNPGLGIPE